MTSKTVKAPISAEFSAYLDVLRFLAATFVLLFHVRKLEFGPDRVRALIPDHGHDFVILFFVLSGYVIAAATERKLSRGLRDYLLDRAARVYSVSVPTLLLCGLLAVFFHPLFDPKMRWDSAILHPALNFLANMVFISESWSMDTRVFLNDPYWSLCYEVMYYAAFGIFMFLRGWSRWVGVILVALVAGPRVLLLAPCWIMGVLAYRWRDAIPLNRWAAVALGFLAPPVALAALHKIGFGPAVRGFTQEFFGDHRRDLGFSEDFLIDYMTALLVTFNIYGSRFLAIPIPAAVKSFASAGAAMSFTLYLMHMPLLMLLLYWTGEGHTSLSAFAAVVIGIPIACFLISRFTELKRPLLRSALERAVGYFSSSFGTARSQETR